MPSALCSCRSRSASLDDDANEVRKNAYHGPRDQHKNEYPGDPFLEVGVFTKEVSGIKEESHQENDAQDYGENSSDRVGNISDRIFDPSYLRECRDRKKHQKSRSVK